MALQAIFPAHPQHPQLPANAAGWLVGGTWVTIQALTRPDLTVSLLLDEAGAQVTRSGGIWEEYARPRDVGIVEYNGRELQTQTLAVVFDGWPNYNGAKERWMDRYIDIVEEIADRGLPLRLVGPVSHAERKWVIQGIDYGDQIRTVDSGRRLRQKAVLHLLEYVVGEYLEKLPKSTAQPRSFRWYLIAPGDDLQKIAVKTLGRAAQWPQIEALNDGLRGVKLGPAFPAGTRIKVPKE